MCRCRFVGVFVCACMSVNDVDKGDDDNEGGGDDDCDDDNKDGGDGDEDNEDGSEMVMIM